MSKKATRPKGYISDYRPQRKTKILLSQVLNVLEEYEDYLPLALRQVFYRLVGKFGFPKTENDYDRLSGHVSNARRAGWIPWEAIRDDGVIGGAPLHFFDELDFWRYALDLAHRSGIDATAQQLSRVEVLCEAGGMVSQLRRVTNRYSIPIYSSGGFDSTTAKKDMAERLIQDGRQAVIFHLGDFDPSGESLFDVIAEDVTSFIQTDAPWMEVEFRRVALTRDQVSLYGLPTAPPKKSDSRSRSWTGQTCQLEAVPPDLIAALLTDSIEQAVDMDVVHEARERDPAFRATLIRKLRELEKDAA
jgi:hypothetical protein